MKRILSLLLTLTLLLVLAGCNPATSGNAIKIGGLAPLTGNVSVYGIAATNGAKMAIEEINAAGGVLGRKIDFNVLDEKGDVTEAVNAYQKLVSEKIDLLIGDVTTKPSISVAQRAAQDGMPMITPTGTGADITKQGNNVFRTCFIDPYQGKIMADFAADTLKVKNVAVISNAADDYSVGLTKAFEAQARAKGLNVVASETYGAKDVDFKAQLTKIAAAKPDALFVPDYYERIAMIIKQAKEAGLSVPMLGGDGWDGVVGQFKDNPADADGHYFANHYSMQDPDPKVQNFLKNYQNKYKTEANSFAALGYDTVYVVKAALEKAGSTDKKAVIQALAQTNFSGITGSFTFDAERNPVKSVAITTIKDGKYVLHSTVKP